MSLPPCSREGGEEQEVCQGQTCAHLLALEPGRDKPELS